MAKKQKASPYDNAAGRGTGNYLAQSPGAVTERSSPPRAMPPSGPPGRNRDEEGPPDSTMLGAFLSTFFCFPPLGIVALVWALRVRPRWKRGDEGGAKHAAAMAEKFTFAAVGAFVILFGIGAIIYGIYWFQGPRNRF